VNRAEMRPQKSIFSTKIIIVNTYQKQKKTTNFTQRNLGTGLIGASSVFIAL
jgi:hypothetical protein